MDAFILPSGVVESSWLSWSTMMVPSGRGTRAPGAGERGAAARPVRATSAPHEPCRPAALAASLHDLSSPSVPLLASTLGAMKMTLALAGLVGATQAV